MKEIFNPHPMTIGNGPKCWIDFSDADSYTESPAARISEIRDKSGRGNTFNQTVELEKPYIATVGGRTVADFQGGESLKTAGHRPDLNLTYYDMFWVYPELPTIASYVFSSYDVDEDNGWSLDYDPNGGSGGTFIWRIKDDDTGGGVTLIGTVGDEVPPSGVFWTRVLSDSGVKVGLNISRGVKEETPSTEPYAPNTDAPTYMGALEGVSDFLTGKIGEFLMFDPLEVWQGEQVSQYLMNKWGIS